MNKQKITIEKQDSRTVTDGNVYHAGLFIDEKGKEFSFTLEEIKMNGSSELFLVWCDDLPFEREIPTDPYTIEGSQQDSRRIAIAQHIIDKFVGMNANTELE